MTGAEEQLYAGYLCATHVGKVLRILRPPSGAPVEGVCHAVVHSEERTTVRVILWERGEMRDDGSVRKVHHCLELDPRAVVVAVED